MVGVKASDPFGSVVSLVEGAKAPKATLVGDIVDPTIVDSDPYP